MWGAAKNLVLKSQIKKEVEVDEEEESVIHDEEKEKEELDESQPQVKSIFELISQFTKDKLKKKDNATPDKEGSPRSQGTSRSNAFDESEMIKALAVKEEDLLALRKSIDELLKRKQDEETQTKQTLAIRKPKPREQLKVKVTKKIVVARPAPPNASLKVPELSGPRCMESGEIIPYSVLGSVEEFVDEALKRKELLPNSPAVVQAPTRQSGKLEVRQYKRPWVETRGYIPTAMNQQNALRNWRRKMAERKRLQGHISNLLEKPLDRLIMNQDDKVRKIQETKIILDRSIPAVDYGKGYRVGSEFWKQSESIGDENAGIKTTLSKTEQGSPVVFEHIGKPINIQHETGETWQGDQATHDPRKTWLKSKYLKKRMKQLEPIMNNLDPFKPDLSNLEIIGNDEEGLIRFHTQNFRDNFAPETQGGKVENENDPFSIYREEITRPVNGPGLLFNGKPVVWTGSSDKMKDRVFTEQRISFNCITKQKEYSTIEIENIGTTAIFYDWRKIPQSPSFDVLTADSVQRFYFNISEGFILPGDTAKIQFVFKSPNVGIFSETWKFITEPSLVAGASLLVVLRGVANEDEKTTKEEREKFDNELRKKEALFDVQQIISDILKGIQPRERVSSPIDAYVTEQEIFERKNPGRHYDHDTIMELKNVYVQLFGEDDREGREWDLSLDELQSCVTAVPDETAQEELLVELNKIISRLSFPPLTPKQRIMYASAYKSWIDTIDKVVGCAMLTRSIMGLPEMIMIEAVPSTDLVPPASAAPPPSGKAEAKEDKKGKGKKGKDAKEEKGKKGKTAGKDAKDSRPKSKDPKGKGAKPVVQTPTKELLPPDRNDVKTPSIPKPAPSDTLDASVRKKYSEKMYGQVYELLVEMFESMTIAFEETQLQDL